MNAQYIKKSLYSTLLFLMLGLGISLQIKAGIGQSMLNAFSLLLADLLNLEIGTLLNFLNLLFFIIYLIIRKT
ncbi:membrane spanning protein, partial [Clostridium sartagoforme AAU1]